MAYVADNLFLDNACYMECSLALNTISRHKLFHTIKLPPLRGCVIDSLPTHYEPVFEKWSRFKHNGKREASLVFPTKAWFRYHYRHDRPSEECFVRKMQRHRLRNSLPQRLPFVRRVASSFMADSRFAPSQWEKAWFCNNVSHWLGANRESAMSFVHKITKNPNSHNLHTTGKEQVFL